MQSGKAQVQEVEGHAAEDRKQIRTSSLDQSTRSFTVALLIQSIIY